jgi:hypothetical protein
MDDAFEKVLGAAATYRQPDHSALAAFLERIGDRLVHAGDPLISTCSEATPHPGPVRAVRIC